MNFLEGRVRGGCGGKREDLEEGELFVIIIRKRKWADLAQEELRLDTELVKYCYLA